MMFGLEANHPLLRSFLALPENFTQRDYGIKFKNLGGEYRIRTDLYPVCKTGVHA